MGIEDIQSKARTALHNFMGRPISYYENPTDPSPARQVSSARLFSKEAKVGDLAGTNLSYAEVQERIDRVIFWAADIPTPKRNALVIFSATEAFYVDTVLPSDGFTITAEVVRVDSVAELSGLEDPDGNTIP